MNLERTKEDEVLLAKFTKDFSKDNLLGLLQPNHEVRQPIPIVSKSNLKSWWC